MYRPMKINFSKSICLMSGTLWARTDYCICFDKFLQAVTFSCVAVYAKHGCGETTSGLEWVKLTDRALKADASWLL